MKATLIPRFKLGDKIAYKCAGIIIRGTITGIDIDTNMEIIFYRVDELQPDGTLLRDTSWFSESDVFYLFERGRIYD